MTGQTVDLLESKMHLHLLFTWQVCFGPTVRDKVLQVIALKERINLVS